MNAPNKRQVGKSAAYIYLETLISSASGYILWLILSKLASAEIIGSSSTAISIGTIIVTVVTMGIPNSISRFLGKSFAEGKIRKARAFISMSLLIILVTMVAAAASIIVFKDTLMPASFGYDLIFVTLVFSGASSIALFLRYVVIASLQTGTLVMRETVYSAAKLGLSIILVMLGLGSIGLTLGYTVGQILAVILLSLAVLKIYKLSSDDHFTQGYKSITSEIFRASLPSWGPALITAIGSQLGTIVVYGTQGAEGAGAYFIAFSIATGISTLTYSLLSSTFPALSAMNDGRKRFAWQLTKVCLILSLPLSSSLVFYSNDIMLLFGKTYLAGSSSLAIFLLSMLPITVVTGINILVYAYGDYKKVLWIGLASSIPRITLYFILVPLFGIEGSALSFSLGSIIGFVVSVILAWRIGMKIFWKDLALMFFIPLMLGFIFKEFHMSFFPAIIISLVVTYILLLRFGTLNRTDVHDTLEILPSSISTRAIEIVNLIGSKVNRLY